MNDLLGAVKVCQHTRLLGWLGLHIAEQQREALRMCVCSAST